MALKLGVCVRIDHPLYGERVVTMTAVDEPKNAGVLTCYDCVIDGEATCFGEDMVL